MYDKPKIETTKAVVSSVYRGQPDEAQNEQPQQQAANHSSDNAEIAGCRTPPPPPLSLSLSLSLTLVHSAVDHGEAPIWCPHSTQVSPLLFF